MNSSHLSTVSLCHFSSIFHGEKGGRQKDTFNISWAAEILGITRARVYRKINQLDLKEAVE